jgi:hypothetical protein
MKMVENIFPEKKQSLWMFAWHVTLSQRAEDISSDVQRQLRNRRGTFVYFPLACDESTYVSDNAKLLIFLKRSIDNKRKVIK